MTGVGLKQAHPVTVFASGQHVVWPEANTLLLCFVLCVMRKTDCSRQGEDHSLHNSC